MLLCVTTASFVRTQDPNTPAAYLEARGQAYSSTLSIVQTSPQFEPFSSSSSSAIHHMNLPPSNSAVMYPKQCAVFATNGGYNYNQVKSGY